MSYTIRLIGKTAFNCALRIKIFTLKARLFLVHWGNQKT